MNDGTYHQGEVTHPVCGGTDIYFPVETRPAEVDGREVPGYLAVLRSDTGQVFGFHRAEYRLVRNAELFPQFDEALLECGFDLAGMMVTDAIAYGGARTIRSYRLPRERVEVGVGDPVEFELLRQQRRLQRHQCGPQARLLERDDHWKFLQALRAPHQRIWGDGSRRQA
ncbi:MAG: hypothetical protein ACRD1T_26370 [Acidimicrobiia bacterium]